MINWIINKFKSFNLMTQAALEAFYTILLFVIIVNAMVSMWSEIPMFIMASIIGLSTIVYHVYDIVIKIKKDNKI